jgi:radical SAM protein with 4Fe4S-binding SPASM domain
LDISAGNLIENRFNFRKIWLESKFLNEIRDTSALKGTCGECEYIDACGGCRARAMAMLGDYLAGDPVCGYMPAMRHR